LQAIIDQANKQQVPVVTSLGDGVLLPSTTAERVILTDKEIEERAARKAARRERRKARSARVKEKAARKEKERAARGEQSRELRENHFRKLVTAVVVKAMGKYQKQLSRDQFKEQAKTVCSTPSAS
jgi:hypothetical protein